MAQGASPVAQRRLRAELRRLRDSAGRTQKRVAEDMGWSTSKVIRIETGAVSVTTADLRALLHYYRIDADDAHDLLDIAQGKEEAWWDEYRSAYPQQFINFLGYEDSAGLIRQFMGLVIPGLLQTEDYTRALLAGYATDPKNDERAVRVRMRRQRVLTRDDGPRCQFILDEGVIHRWVGGAQTMAAQLIRLKTLAKQPHISIRMIPFGAGAHPGMLDSFTIFEFADEEDHVVISEVPGRDVLIRDDPEAASRYLETFSELQELACPEGELDKIIDPVIETMRLGRTGHDKSNQAAATGPG